MQCFGYVACLNSRIRCLQENYSFAEEVFWPFSEEEFKSLDCVDHWTRLIVALKEQRLGEAPAAAVGDHLLRHADADLTRCRDDAVVGGRGAAVLQACGVELARRVAVDGVASAATLTGGDRRAAADRSQQRADRQRQNDASRLRFDRCEHFSF